MTRRSTRHLRIWLIVLASGCSTPAGPTPVEAAAGGASAAASEMVSLTNVERREAGITPFAASPRLMRAAQLHAEQMVVAGQMAHTLPDAQYPNPQDRLSAVGYQWQAYAENVAYGQTNPTSALDAWMHSSGHRANILNANLTELGTGYARDAAGRPYYVQVFGNPR